MALQEITLLDREPFKCMVSTIGNLPTSFIDSMSYYEQIAWICQYITDTLIPQINLNTTEINEIEKEFIELKEEVEDAIKDIPQLRADFEALVARFDETLLQLQAQYEAFETEVENEINRKISAVRTEMMSIIDGYNTVINAKIDREVARLDEKIETFPIANTEVFNSLRGSETTLQVYLDDLAGLNRTEAITSGEYDALELGAEEYDDKQITAHDYDYFGKTILTA